VEFNYPACELLTHFPTHYDLVDIYTYISGSLFLVYLLHFLPLSCRPLDLRPVSSFSVQVASESLPKIDEDLGRAFSRLLSRVLAVRSLTASINSAKTEERFRRSVNSALAGILLSFFLFLLFNSGCAPVASAALCAITQKSQTTATVGPTLHASACDREEART